MRAWRIAMVVAATSTLLRVGQAHADTTCNADTQTIDCAGWIYNTTYTNSVAVRGVDDAGFGVYGDSKHNTGVFGGSQDGIGVWGRSSGGEQAVYGEALGYGGGVRGEASSGVGVYGLSYSNSGVFAISTTGTGAAGFTNSGTGVIGNSVSGTGVNAVSNSGTALNATAYSGVGVNASSNTSAIVGVTNGSVGYGPSGVYGANTSTTVDGQGIAGRVYRATSSAVFGENTAAGWAGYFVGNVYVSGTVTQSSDARLKKDIKDSPYGLAQVLELRPIRYKWKKEGSDDKVQLGLIAQEVQKVVPEVVVDGQPSGMLAINYTALLPVAIKAIKEQQQMIQRQEARLAALEHGRVAGTVALPSGGVAAGLAFGLVPLGMFAVSRRRAAAARRRRFDPSC